VRKLIYIMLLPALLLSLTGCGSTYAMEQLPDLSVTTAAASAKQLEATVDVAGVLTPNATATVASKMSGSVTKVNADVGQTVNAGDVLVSLDTRDLNAQLATAQAAYNSAQSQADLAKVNLNAAQSGLDVTHSAVSDQVNAAKIAMDAAKTALDAAADQTDLQLQQAQLQVDQANIGVENAQNSINSAENGVSSAQNTVKTAESGIQSAESGIQSAESGVQSAESNAVSAQNALDTAQKNFDRTQQLVDAGVLPQVNLDSAQSSLDTAQAAVNSAQAAVNSAKAGVSAAQANLVSAQSGAASAQTGVEQAQNGVKTAQNALKTAQNSVKTAQAAYDLAQKSAQSALDAAQAKYDSAKAAYDQASGSGAQSQLVAAQSKVDTAREQYKVSSTSGLEQAQAAMDSINLQLSYAEVKANISGVVVNRNINGGEIAAAGTPLFSLADVSKLKLKGTISQDALPFVKEGQKVDVVVDIYPNKTLQGSVISVGPIAVSTGSYFPCEITLDNADNGLAAGLSAHASIHITGSGHVTVPNAAIVQNSGSAYVFVIKNKTAHKTDVVLGLKNDKETEILRGVNEGDAVAVTNVNTLFDQMPIQS